MARLDVAGQRWVAELADYNFTINYRPVRANVDAGWLCSIPMYMSCYVMHCAEAVSPKLVNLLIFYLRIFLIPKNSS